MSVVCGALRNSIKSTQSRDQFRKENFVLYKLNIYELMLRGMLGNDIILQSVLV